jgi:hypothetical protein
MYNFETKNSNPRKLHFGSLVETLKYYVLIKYNVRLK